MGERVEINGHPTWVDQHGSGDTTVLIMHGGLSNSDTLEALTSALAEQYLALFAPLGQQSRD